MMRSSRSNSRLFKGPQQHAGLQITTARPHTQASTMTACNQSLLPSACISAHWPAKPAVKGMPARLNTPSKKAADVHGRHAQPWMWAKSVWLPTRAGE